MNIEKGRKEILNTLRTLKHVCLAQNDCDECPLHEIDSTGTVRCGVQESAPGSYRLKGKESTWNAFKG